MMTKRGNLIAIGALLMLGAIFAALTVIGSEADGRARPQHVVQVDHELGSCKVGDRASLRAPRASSRRSAVWVLACGKSHSQGEFQIVGYAAGEGVCVSIDSLRWMDTHGGLCKPASVPWLELCPRSAYGCVISASAPHGFTELTGVLGGSVRGVRVRPVRKVSTDDVAVAQVHDGLLTRLHQSEPFGYFVAFIRGCVDPANVRIEVFDGTGVLLDALRRFHQPGFRCPDAN